MSGVTEQGRGHAEREQGREGRERLKDKEKEGTEGEEETGAGGRNGQGDQGPHLSSVPGDSIRIKGHQIKAVRMEVR